MSDNDFDQLARWRLARDRRDDVNDLRRAIEEQRQRTYAIYGTRADFERLRRESNDAIDRLVDKHFDQQPAIGPHIEPKAEAIGVCLGPLGAVVRFERVDLYTFDLFVSGAADAVRMAMPNAESAARFAEYLEHATRQQ